MRFPALLTKLPTTLVLLSPLRTIDRSATNSFATLLILLFVGFAPPTVAQPQHCLSGAVTSILGCNGCSFNANVGDPVAITFNVQPSSITCTSTSLGTSCGANATFSANIGARHWTTLNSQNPYSAVVGLTAVTIFGNSSSNISLFDSAAVGGAS